jgi:hypothetical protein
MIPELFKAYPVYNTDQSNLYCKLISIYQTSGDMHSIDQHKFHYSLSIRPTKAGYNQIIYEMLDQTKIMTKLRLYLLISKGTFVNKS